MIIEYTELSRNTLLHGGYKIVGQFKDSDPSGNYDQVRRFFVDSEDPTEDMVTARVDYFINKSYYGVNPLNRFNLGKGNERIVVNTVVVFVRAHPATGVPGVVSEIDSEHPHMLWKPNKFLIEMRQYLDHEMGTTYTFDEFKQFLIDEKFIGVD